MNIELKPIAESKVRQLGGDVCGVLVRKDEKLAAVDEHGRVQWLQGDSEHTAYLESMNAHLKAELKAARAQGGQGAEPIGFTWDAGRFGRQFTADAGVADRVRVDGVAVLPVYTQPQPAVPEEFAEDLRTALLEAWAGVDGQKRRVGHEWLGATKNRLLALLSTTTTPQADAPISGADRVPVKSDGDYEGKIWIFDTSTKQWFRGNYWEFGSPRDSHWMPTGLKRPQPPAGQEGA